MVNIKVAVRIRPLSERELLHGEEKIVRSEKNSVLVTNPKIPERQDGDSRQRTRRFTVDFCYDSTNPEGSTQESVYKGIGSEVLKSMYEGYNSCVLAYGPSASGKTYTIMGLQDDPGLTPRLCEGLFEKLMERKKPQGGIRIQIIISLTMSLAGAMDETSQVLNFTSLEHTYSGDVALCYKQSFLEIYNEKVRDLLGSEEEVGTCGNFSLRVREHPKLGPYVQGLSQHFVTEKRKLLELLAAGNRRRSTAATENNIHSSRSHAVFTIQFKQSDGENYQTEKSSKVHLVDLAGSERASASQDKTRLQEGANINKSLVTLGNVISALAESCDSGIRLKDHSSSKSWQPFVPYRDSVLTWLLKDTLGGNSNTIMIATISPASSCLSETVNTLRYAKRTKKIVNQPIVNEDPKIRTIRELRKEITRLKGLLIFLQACDSEESRCGSTENNLKERNCFYSPESKWQEPEDTHNPNREWHSDRKPNWKKKKIVKKETNEDDEKSEKSSTSEECEERGDACEISDEKKSDVNGSVNDNFSHETQIFSDSLESLPSVFLKGGNLCDDLDGNDSENLDPADDGGEMQEADAQTPSPNNLTNEFCTFDLSITDFPEMLHRSRPDLIKGISTRSKGNLPLGSSQSCTDVSNLSNSTSENSLNSSGSADVQSSKSKSFHNPAQNTRNSPEVRAVTGKYGTARESRRSDNLETGLKKKEKRLEVVEAVTTRLYVTKKNQNAKMAGKKDDDDYGGDDDDVGEPEELKLCKRARMKLFDLSRKLAMRRKMKKTVDSDTQTDRSTGILRVKEKCVTTDPSGETGFESTETVEESSQGKKEPCVIMNQVFIPRAWNYVVECGKVVRIEAPEASARQESSTQTSHGFRSFNNANTSPDKFSPQEEDCFSEDSLDLDFKNKGGHHAVAEEEQKPDDKMTSRTHVRFDWPFNFNSSSNSDINRFREETSFQNRKKRTELGDILIEGLPVTVFLEKRNHLGHQTTFFTVEDILESRLEENISSENSFTSADGTEINSVSETSSEDFVFFENQKERELSTAAKSSDRELYTITENSEQSDLSDGFSPVQKQGSCLKGSEGGETTQKWARRSENEFRDELETSEEARNTGERSSSSRGVPENDRSKRTSVQNELKVSGEHPQESVTSDFTGRLPHPRLDSKKKPLENAKVERSASASGTARADPRSSDRGTCQSATDFRTANGSDGSGSEKVEDRGTQITGSDMRLNSQAQYLNLNISNGGSNGKAPPFSVDTHLFGKPSKKDQSTDTMSTSADSITFVFMGPAKPKTSVLIELIKRSLGQNFHPSEIPFGQRKRRSRGVQCDANLMRSVSVDTAMIALSRIAKNQESFPEIKKTNSLGALSTGEMTKILGGGKITQQARNCQCDVKTEFFQGEKEKCTSKHSSDIDEAFDEYRKNLVTKNKKQETEKPKKSVSWFGDGRGRVDVEGVESPWERQGSQESDVVDSFDLTERRVRFLKPDQRALQREQGFAHTKTVADYLASSDSLTAFLREATHLLKSINSRSSNNEAYSEEAAENVSGESCRKKEDNRRGAPRLWKTSEPTGRKRAEGQGEGGWWRFKAGTTLTDENRMNSTWPRRRSTAGKPPTGTRPKFSRSFLPSRFDSSHSYGFANFTANPRTWSQSSRTGSWNLSNLSVALSNSCLGETQSRSSSSRSCCNDAKWVRDSCSSPVTMPRTDVPKLSFNSLSELEMNVEECCRHLEIAMEKDEAREKIWESRNMARHGKEEETAGKSWPEIKKSGEALKRRKTESCAGSCSCRKTTAEPCKRLWSKGCRSTFELDSFGPGRAHCSQLCMFCRKKDEEMYYSALNLNSGCSSDLCRLDYYGFCPCSPVKLNQVVSSPRAYMQHLLALRKQIVTGTKFSHVDSEAHRQGNSRKSGGKDFSWLGLSNFSINANEI